MSVLKAQAWSDSTLPSLDVGDVNTISLDQEGKVRTVGPSGTSSTEVQGTTPDGDALIGNPLPIAGVDGSGNVQTVLTNTDGEININGYDSTITSNRVFETAPVNQTFLLEELVDATDQAISNYYYSVSMDDYKDISFEFELSADATITIEASNDVSFTTPKDVTLVATELVTGTSAASFTNSNGILDISNINITYVRVKLAITSATNSALIVSRKKAL